MILKDTFYTLVPINGLLRVTALSSISRKGIQLQASTSMVKSVIYTLVLTFVNLLFVYLKLSENETDRFDVIVKFTRLLEFIYWFSFFVYIIDLFFIQKYGGNALLKYIKTYDALDRTLGAADYNKIRRTILISMELIIGATLFVALFDYITWVVIEGWVDPSMYTIDYLYWFLNVLTILDVVSHIIQVEFRLKLIQRLLLVSNCFAIVKK